MGTRARFLQKTHLRLNNKSQKGQKFQMYDNLEKTQDLLDILFSNNNYFFVFFPPSLSVLDSQTP